MGYDVQSGPVRQVSPAACGRGGPAGWAALAAVLVAVLLPLPAPAAVAPQVPWPRPWRQVTVEGGEAPQVRSTAAGSVIANVGRVTAVADVPDDAFLCRLEPGPNRDVVQLACGRVQSRLCRSLFSPARDQAVTLAGDDVELAWRQDHWEVTAAGPLTATVEDGFLKHRRGLAWYQPLDRAACPRPPAGWCSWYVYGQTVTDDLVRRHADWLATNLGPFGCEYVQVDDGWQGVGTGMGENRDWFVTDRAKFPHGMKALAAAIRARGLRPGIWCIPFTTSDEELFRREPQTFLRRPDGGSVFEIVDPVTGGVVIDWAGRFAVDPTAEGGQAWFRRLVGLLCDDWGYEYVKIDAQSAARSVCQNAHDRLANPALAPDEAYRAGLAALRTAMGPGRFLLNCGGQLDSCGYCQGLRTGADVAPSWAGFQPALQATCQWLYLNGIAFWTDPDVLCVRPRGQAGSTLTPDQARLWATLYGITGQLLMLGDDLLALPPDRVALLRRLLPVADIRPMELYPLPGKPRVFDLRIATPAAGQWDVVAVFNWQTREAARVAVDPVELGLPAGDYLFYDGDAGALLGVQGGPLTVHLAPTSSRLLVVRPAADHPQVLGTSRHLTHGAADLLAAAWDPAGVAWHGRSRLVAEDPYEVRFSLPPGWECAEPGVQTARGLAVLTLRSGRGQDLDWRVAFRREPAAAVPAAAVRQVQATLTDRLVTVSWSGTGALSYRVYRDGERLGQTAAESLVEPVRGWHRSLRYEVAAVGWQGESPRVPATTVALPPPPPRTPARDVWLQNLRPVSAVQDWEQMRKGRSVESRPLRIAGTACEYGIGTHANSEVVYTLGNRYRQFEATLGLDDEATGGSVVFQVEADGTLLYDSGVVRSGQSPRLLRLPLVDVDELVLRVTDAGDGTTGDHADWGDARLLGYP